MVHNIGQMFYYGELPWHEPGNEIKQTATVEEANATHTSCSAMATG